MAVKEFDNEELIALARLDVEKGDLESGLSKLKQVVKSKDDVPEAKTMLARLYAQLGLFDKAQEFYQSFLDDNPDALVESFQFGMTYFDSGERNRAIDIWNGVLEKNPVFPPALYYKSVALMQEGQSADAKISIEKLLQSAPSDNLYFGKAKELIDGINKSSDSAANQNLDASIARFPKDAYKTEH
jgi:tetratricopeptide (TPR) repeat protein